MHVPVTFRVMEMRATESGHHVTLQEQRELPMRTGDLGPPQMPPAVLSLEVSRDQFAALRISQTFGLEPLPDVPSPVPYNDLQRTMANNQYAGAPR